MTKGTVKADVVAFMRPTRIHVECAKALGYQPMPVLFAVRRKNQIRLLTAADVHTEVSL